MAQPQPKQVAKQAPAAPAAAGPRSPEFCCPNCAAPRSGNESKCPDCGADMHVAKLTCTVSPGSGGEVGQVWPLLPREYTIGRQSDNDLMMGDNFVSRHHIRLIFMDGSFFAKNLATNRDEGEPEFCKLENEDFLSVGTGRLKVEYILPGVSVSLDALRAALESVYEMHFAPTAEESCQELLRGFLRITELEKGYAFSIRNAGGEMQLTELAAVSADGSPLLPQDYRLSQTLLGQVLSHKGEALIYSEDLKGAPASSSIARFRLKSIICVPLLNGNDETAGILYGDSQRMTTHQLSQFKPCLMALARLLMRHLLASGLMWK